MKRFDALRTADGKRRVMTNELNRTGFVGTTAAVAGADIASDLKKALPVHAPGTSVKPDRPSVPNKLPARHRPGPAPALRRPAENLRRYAGGGTLLVQHANGHEDDRLHARLGGCPAAPLRKALGIRVEECRPLRRDERITLSDGTQGTAWSESLHAEGAETLATCTHGMLAGSPAVTRNAFGSGRGWYLSTRLDDVGHGALVARLLDETGVGPETPGLPRRSRPSPGTPRTAAAGAS
ncbi:beta-galactosidase trimerization domain-containing protein [Streptomyces canus]|uniref:beta-galactosidase trimerization domain-containing protein n=1 Tax=Streptomyces canus TaxID=58343 RepID=UPI0032564A04